MDLARIFELSTAVDNVVCKFDGWYFFINPVNELIGI
jgi:hypothetical protein